MSKHYLFDFMHKIRIRKNFSIVFRFIWKPQRGHEGHLRRWFCQKSQKIVHATHSDQPQSMFKSLNTVDGLQAQGSCKTFSMVCRFIYQPPGGHHGHFRGYLAQNNQPHSMLTLLINFRHRIRITESLPIVFRFIYQPPGRTLLTIRSLFLVLVPNRDFSGKLG